LYEKAVKPDSPAQLQTFNQQVEEVKKACAEENN